MNQNLKYGIYLHSVLPYSIQASFAVITGESMLGYISISFRITFFPVHFLAKWVKMSYI